MSRKRFCRYPCGFTLIEVLIATAVLIVIAVGVAHLTGAAIHSGRASREQTATTILAAAKLEQLRSLTWSYTPDFSDPPSERTDTTADLSREPATNGGPGLSGSPPGTLAANTPPYVDYLDEHGRWVGNGAAAPPNAMFVRRWSVRPLPADPSRTVVLSVLVATVAQDHSRAGPWTARSGTESLLVTLTTRKGRQ